MHIVLFGGAFDPPHLGHISVVKNFLDLKLVDRLVFLPVFNHAFDKDMMGPQHRLKMLEEVKKTHFKDLPVYISEYEIHKEGMSITYETLEELTKENPRHTYSFLIGSDNLESFHKWHHFEEMLEKYKFFVYPRAGYSFDNLREGMIALKYMPEMKVSSSVIRENLENKKSVDDLLSSEIIDYIKENELY
ncbi:MAG: nicotinate (nicotinamide) nucleotide adenylyltransferase [Candidatus Pacebacteria bacterium]|nr:nicotinate (nicotinamide) nucleotide adenylyltransferase [Candidatus Paceibacterota bacterium]